MSHVPQRDLSTFNSWVTAVIQCDVSGATTPMPAAPADLRAVLTLISPRRTTQQDNPSATVALDQVQVNGTSTKPAVRSERGCITSHDCAAIAVHGGDGASAFLWGTVYVPKADVDLDFGGSSTFRFARGVVVHRLTITNLPSAPGFVPISLPLGGIYSTRTVEFAATVGDDSDPTLTARVEFADSRCLSDPALAPPCLGVPAQIQAWQPRK